MNSLDTPRNTIEAPALFGFDAAPVAAPRVPVAAPRVPVAAQRAAGLPTASPRREPQGRHFDAEIRRWMLDVAGEGPAPAQVVAPRRVGGLVSRSGAARREHVAGPRQRARRALCA